MKLDKEGKSEIEGPLRLNPLGDLFTHVDEIPLELYGDAILSLPLIVNGRRTVMVGEFAPVATNEEIKENLRKALLYFMSIFGPDTFLNFMLEYKSLD